MALFEWCMKVSDLKYLILTIDEANEASCTVAERAGFELVFDKNGDLVTDSINGGTYNFSDPKGVKGKINHFLKDMVPYYNLGKFRNRCKDDIFFSANFWQL